MEASGRRGRARREQGVSARRHSRGRPSSHHHAFSRGETQASQAEGRGGDAATAACPPPPASQLPEGRGGGAGCGGGGGNEEVEAQFSAGRRFAAGTQGRAAARPRGIEEERPEREHQDHKCLPHYGGIQRRTGSSPGASCLAGTAGRRRLRALNWAVEPDFPAPESSRHTLAPPGTAHPRVCRLLLNLLSSDLRSRLALLPSIPRCQRFGF